MLANGRVACMVVRLVPYDCTHGTGPPVRYPTPDNMMDIGSMIPCVE